jgi:hypothetical protein
MLNINILLAKTCHKILQGWNRSKLIQKGKSEASKINPILALTDFILMSKKIFNGFIRSK